MRQERWFRGGDGSSAFDWQRPAQDLDVPLDVARALYLRATRLVGDPRRAEVLYQRWLRDAAAARPPVTPAPVPGRRTRVEHEARDQRQPRPENAATVGLGKWTRALLETEIDEAVPGAQEVHRVMAALSAGAVRPSSARPSDSLREDDAQTSTSASTPTAFPHNHTGPWDAASQAASVQGQLVAL
ncbi:MAG TPA: hypothetical protein VF516_14685, partial [Kofleriaceae bacterium]